MEASRIERLALLGMTHFPKRLLAALALAGASLSGTAGAVELPAEVQTYIKHRYGGDRAQQQAITQLAKAYQYVAYAPMEHRKFSGELMAQAVSLVRAERCVQLRFAKSGVAPTAVMHSLQRVVITDSAGVAGWNYFVASYKDRTPPRVSGDSCD